MKISKHIRRSQISTTATRFNISNDPNNVQLEYMQDVAELVFEPLRILKSLSE
jgi:hypothetical protein